MGFAIRRRAGVLVNWGVVLSGCKRAVYATMIQELEHDDKKINQLQWQITLNRWEVMRLQKESERLTGLLQAAEVKYNKRFARILQQLESSD